MSCFYNKIEMIISATQVYSIYLHNSISWNTFPKLIL